METTREPVTLDAPHDKAQTETPEISGAETMRNSADKALQTFSKKICDALVDKATTGHMLAARLLYLIAIDQLKGKPADLGKALLMANEWAAEKKWLEEVTEQTAETTNGSREPE